VRSTIMKRIFYLTGLLFLVFYLFTYQFAYAVEFKWIRVGSYQTRVVDSGDQGASSGENTFAYYCFDAFSGALITHAGWHLGTRDWTDEKGNFWPVKISGCGHGSVDEIENTIPVPDEAGLHIRKYVRYQPPTIIVDGFTLNEPFPRKGDEVAPDKIPGTADAMVESWINTSMGITIHQKVFGWSQTNHDDYMIFDWTFTNTGNVDVDDEVELPEQTLEDVYFLRANNFNRIGTNHPWNSAYGEYPTDTLRMSYAYPQRSKGSTSDDFGDPRSSGYLRRPCYGGEPFLHVEKSVDDQSDDPSQPQMTGVQSAETAWIKLQANQNSSSDHALLYQTMQFGFKPFDGTPYMEGAYPETHHGLRQDEQGFKFAKDFPWFSWRTAHYTACGPYTLKPGDSFRIVWSNVFGTISIEKSWEIGTKWNKKIDIEPPEGCVFGVTDNLPPPYKKYPELYAKDSKSSEYNNWAKDCWVCTGKDSLFQNAWAAQWNCRNNYNVPIAPTPPSVEIKSLPDRIRIEWDGTESEKASDFAGYRVYSAVGSPNYNATGGVIVGKWVPIFECGKGTNSFDDVSAERGKAYFYYVAAFDDGIGNITDVHGRRESLESGIYLNRTTKGAYLTRPAGSLSAVRVVPNPFNINAEALQYPGEPDKIMFLDVPAYCTIKIYTESGDLVKNLYHTDGSGDESWGVLMEEHMTTLTGQIVVSGIYIAVIEENNEDGTPTGNSTALKFVVVR